MELFTASMLAIQPPSLAESVVEAAMETGLAAFVDGDMLQTWKSAHTAAELDIAPPAEHDEYVLAARIFLQQAFLMKYSDLSVESEWEDADEKAKFETALQTASGEKLELELKALAMLVQFNNSGINVAKIFYNVKRVDVGMGLVTHAPVALLRSREWLCPFMSHFDNGDENLPADFETLIDHLVICEEELKRVKAYVCTTVTTDGCCKIEALTRDAAARISPLLYARMCKQLVLSAPTMCPDVAKMVESDVAGMDD